MGVEAGVDGAGAAGFGEVGPEVRRYSQGRGRKYGCRLMREKKKKGFQLRINENCQKETIFPFHLPTFFQHRFFNICFSIPFSPPAPFAVIPSPLAQSLKIPNYSYTLSISNSKVPSPSLFFSARFTPQEKRKRKTKNEKRKPHSQRFKKKKKKKQDNGRLVRKEGGDKSIYSCID